MAKKEDFGYATLGEIKIHMVAIKELFEDFRKANAEDHGRIITKLEDVDKNNACSMVTIRGHEHRIKNIESRLFWFIGIFITCIIGIIALLVSIVGK